MTAPEASPPPPAPVPPARPAPTIPGEPAGVAPPARKKLKRWPFVVGGVVAALAIGVVAGWGPISRGLARSYARDHGVVIDELASVGLGWGKVTLEDFSFHLEDVEGISGKGESLTVGLSGTRAKRLDAKGVELELVGSAAVLAVAISEWTGSHPELVRIPADVDDLAVSWRESEDGPVWLSLSGGSIEPLKAGARLSAERTTVLGIPAGEAGAVWQGDAANVKLAFGADDVGEAPVSIEVTNLKKEPKAHIELKPTPLTKLAGPLVGVFLPIDGITVSGEADLRYAGAKKAPIVGSMKATLAGFVPPMPREAQGFIFADKTDLSTDIEISPDRKSITLSKIHVTHGAIVLDGKGTMTRTKGGAAIEVDLDGHVTCQALGKAALKAGLGQRLGGVAEALASGAIKGNVNLGLKIKANTQNLLGTKIDRTIGIGCGLKWPSEIPKIPGLPDLPFNPF